MQLPDQNDLQFAGLFQARMKLMDLRMRQFLGQFFLHELNQFGISQARVHRVFRAIVH